MKCLSEFDSLEFRAGYYECQDVRDGGIDINDDIEAGQSDCKGNTSS